MHIVFITRCYKPTNIQIIKNNLKEVFSSSSEHTYQQYLVVDMTHGEKQEDFNAFKDNVTSVWFTYQKVDRYNYDGVDKVVSTINKENTFIYVLDDDNLIKDNFLHIFDNYNNEDMIVFPDDDPVCYHYGDEICEGGLDLCNYITKLETMKQLKFYDGRESASSDGRFAVKVLKSQKKMLYLKDAFVIYGTLPKPE